MIDVLEDTKQIKLPGTTTIPETLQNNRWPLDKGTTLISALPLPSQRFTVEFTQPENATSVDPLGGVNFKVTYQTSPQGSEDVLFEKVSKSVSK